MSTRKHVVYSATRQWNPGDEFILRGARRVIEAKIGPSNAILYNRNPDARPDSFELALRADKNVMRGLYGDTEAYLRYGFHDNSVKPDGDFSFVDLAVVAGSPEWTTPRCYNFFEHVVKNATPIVILGVGYLEETPPPFVVEVAKKARFFSVRSEDLLVDRDWARDAGAVYLPCPALLAADEKNERKIDAVRRIALVYSAPERDSIRANSVPNDVADAILALYRRLLETRSERVEFFGVCHYIDELPGATRFFNEFGVPVFYSYDSADYEEIYGRADLTVSARVHACGLSASLGVPGVFFGTDARAGTCRGFLSEFLDYRADYSIFERKIDRISEEIAPRNAELLRHKRRTFDAYLAALDGLSFEKTPYDCAPPTQTPQTKRRRLETLDAIRRACCVDAPAPTLWDDVYYRYRKFRVALKNRFRSKRRGDSNEN